jgi:hypothetical protein
VNVSSLCWVSLSFNPTLTLIQKQRRQIMTTLLENAFEPASKLSDNEQNALARCLLEELEAERN